MWKVSNVTVQRLREILLQTVSYNFSHMYACFYIWQHLNYPFQGWFQVCAQPMIDGVTLWRHLSLNGRKTSISSEFTYYNYVWWDILYFFVNYENANIQSIYLYFHFRFWPTCDFCLNSDLSVGWWRYQRYRASQSDGIPAEVRHKWHNFPYTLLASNPKPQVVTEVLSKMIHDTEYPIQPAKISCNTASIWLFNIIITIA